MLALLALACHDDPTTTDGSSPSTHDSGTTTSTTPTHTTPPPPAADNLAWSLNPDVGAVVSASWDQAVAGTTHVEYSFDEGVWESSPSFDAGVGPQTQTLVGIPFATTAEWRVVVGDATVDGPEIETAPVPAGLPFPHVETADPTRWLADGKYLLCSINQSVGTWIGGNYWTFLVDRQGRYVWAHLAPNKHWTLFAQISVLGDRLMWDESTAWSNFDSGAGSRIHETWLDEEIDVVPTPGLHHEWVQLPDGTLAWGSQYHDSTEALVERAPGQTDETVIWTCDDDWPGSGNCESNGLFYDALTDTYLYSFYTNSSIASVARSGDTANATPGWTRWWAGSMSGGFDFDPPESQYYWQHGISYTDTRTLLVSSKNKGNTWLLEYEVDEDAGRLNFVWGSNSHVLAEDNGAAWRLSNGDTLHVVGTAGVIREVAPDDTEVWRLAWDAQHNLGEGQFVSDLYALIKPRE